MVLDVGADRGVAVGQTFTVYRGGEIVGELEVERVTADLGGARIRWEDTFLGGVLTGDRVEARACPPRYSSK